MWHISATISAVSTTPHDERLKYLLPSATKHLAARTAGKARNAGSANKLVASNSTLVRSMEKPHGARMMTSASCRRSGPSSVAEFPPAFPQIISPPPASTHSAIQYPLPMIGAIHSRCATLGRSMPGMATSATVARTTSRRAFMWRTKRVPRSGTQHACATVITSPKTSLNVFGSTVTIWTALSPNDAHATCTSSLVTAQMRHWSCVMMTLGLSASTLALKM
mmetsp:Transcript_169796/g.544954  ORF Transcript_169796/g.544954 Transcript_169796/m.544954 type:complete len:222 (-) Transcript_169796:290-955(-)